MDEEEKRRAYSEIVEILKLIDDEEKLEKIPFEIIEMIKNNSDPTYTPQISKDIPLDQQNLSKTTYGILAWLSSKFWGDDDNKKDKFGDTENDNLKDNEEDVDTEDSKDVDDKQGKEENNEEEKQEGDKEEKISAIVYSDLDPEFLEKIEKLDEKTNLPISINSLKFYEKMIIKIMHFLRKIFKANHANLREGVNE